MHPTSYTTCGASQRPPDPPLCAYVLWAQYIHVTGSYSVYACSITIAHVSSMGILHACIKCIVRSLGMNLVHVCTKIIARACAMIKKLAVTQYQMQVYEGVPHLCDGMILLHVCSALTIHTHTRGFRVAAGRIHKWYTKLGEINCQLTLS